ncbi:putative membrane protein [Nakamurella sp. UYEF19]|uniref:anthrone oxygenase family protein n=1 Tax=Nakamurella sp. UYEF19 TaxID=1756392 RepID=UPI0033914C22
MNALRLTTALTAAACGISGGVLFAFSTMVMPALRTQTAAAATATMQAINVAAPRSIFMLPLIGSAVGCVAVGLQAVLRSDVPNRPLLLTGAATGLLVMLITAIYHVPRNNAFAILDPSSTGITAAWAAYDPGWTAWNHVRSVAGLVSAGLLLLSRPWVSTAP